MFDARQALDEARQVYRAWQFIDLDGNVQELPHPLMLDPASVAGLENDPEALFTKVAPEAAAAMNRMPPAALDMTVKAWRAHVEAETDASGKEQSPSSATALPAQPSKRTARSGGSTSGRSGSGRSGASPKRS
jgi:hypothetical protein